MGILRKGTVSVEFRKIRLKLCGNCACPQNFQTRKLGEITVFLRSGFVKTSQNVWQGFKYVSCLFVAKFYDWLSCIQLFNFTHSAFEVSIKVCFNSITVRLLKGHFGISRWGWGWGRGVANLLAHPLRSPSWVFRLL